MKIRNISILPLLDNGELVVAVIVICLFVSHSIYTFPDLLCSYYIYFFFFSFLMSNLKNVNLIYCFNFVLWAVIKLTPKSYKFISSKAQKITNETKIRSNEDCWTVYFFLVRLFFQNFLSISSWQTYNSFTFKPHSISSKEKKISYNT